MANIKSSEKRAAIGERNRLRNKSVKTNLKTVEKKFLTAVNSNDAEASKTLLDEAMKKFDTAVSKGVLHKNTAARKKSRLQNKFNALG